MLVASHFLPFFRTEYTKFYIYTNYNDEMPESSKTLFVSLKR